MKNEIATFHKRKAGGHYARVMGTLHRHLKTEQCGDAALGMLTRIWSFCADNGRHVLSTRDMATLMVRDKNGPRKLKQLLDAKLLDKVDGGYSPHDWFDHNPGIKPSDCTDGESNASRTRVERESNATGNVTKNVSKPAEQKQDVTGSLSRPKTQEKETLLEREEKRAPAGADVFGSLLQVASDRISENEIAPRLGANPATAELEPGEPERAAELPRRAAFADQVRDALRKAYPGKMPELYGGKLAAVAAHVRGLAEHHGKLPRDVIPALCAAADPSREGWEFRVAAVDPYATQQPARASPGRPGRLTPTRGTTSKDFEHHPDEEEQLAALEAHWGKNAKA